MKGRLPSTIMVFVALAMVFSMLATALAVSPATVIAGTDNWSRQDLPTTNYWQMAPNTDIWDLTAADDGTLFALVEDTSGPADLVGGTVTWDGLRWGVYPAWSDVALFKSTDGGYTWALAWHIPSVEVGAPIAVVPQPGYSDSDAANDQVFVATGGRYIAGVFVGDAGGAGNVYYSAPGSGATQFTKVTPQNPGVVLGGWITSIDVADCGCVSCPSKFMVVVGVTSNTAGALGEGVYTWNRNGTGNWEDLMVSTSTVAPPSPGTLPAGNSIDALAVKFANWTTEKGIIAVVNDLANVVGNAEGTGVYVCFYDGDDGYWGGDLDSPTNVIVQNIPRGWIPAWAQSACMDIGTDYNKTSAARVYVGLDGSGADDVWSVRGLSTVMGPSTVAATGLGIGTSGAALLISDVVVPGTAASGVVYAGCEFPAGQAQVFVSANINAWPSWTPSFKPLSGAWPVFVTMMGETLMAAGGGDGLTWGGVHVKVDAAKGHVFNGVGLLDDIAVSENVPGGAGRFANPEWILAEAVAMDLSLMYGTDEIIFVSTFSEWANPATGFTTPGQAVGALSLWRWDSRGHWERILYEGTQRPNNNFYLGKEMLTTAGRALFVDNWTWWPRASQGFSDDPYVFLLGGRFTTARQEMMWISPDKGDWWEPSPQMPLGAIQNGGVGLSETGWWVLDNNIVFLGDVDGWIYKTTNRSASWTQGVRTAPGNEIVTIFTSPVYSESGDAGTDKAVLVGTWNPADLENEVWISRDGCKLETLKIIGDEINTDPVWGLISNGGVVINFDPGWVNNRTIYATASGWLDQWQLVGMSGTVLERTHYSDVGLYRTVVNLNDPAASTWTQLWGADDYDANALKPQPYTAMTLGQFIQRWVANTGINFGPDGAMYVAFTVWDTSYNTNTMFSPGDNPTPNFGFGRFTDAGVLRLLQPAAANPEIVIVEDGLGPWDGLWLNGVAGGSNHVVSLAWDWKEWRFKLAKYEDTLSGAGPAPQAPVSGATGVGTLVADDSVNVPLTWAAKGGATTYQWQVSEDAAFTPANTRSGITSDLSVTVLDLKPSTTYYWRSRAFEPMIGNWNTPQSFTTVIGGTSGAAQLISPEIGSRISETKPLFTWTAVAGASNYRIQVASDPGFGSAALVIDKSLGNVQAFESDIELQKATYYWRVKATVGGVEVPWSALGSFTIGEPEGAGTAGWVWALIVIGIVLIILMLMLIMRTRRPA